MDLQKLFNSCEILLMQMKEDGYCEDYIKNVRFEINWIKRNPKLLQCTSYLELYEERLKTGRNPESSQERIYHKRSLFTILQRFEENNEFPNHHKKVPLVQKSAYSKLRGAFKELVDYYKKHATQTFHTLWEKANTARCVVPYELRHNYATENINGWTANDSFGLSEHLLYLSKSMGHRNLSSTLYYYSIVPGFADIILEKTEMGFNKIVPEVTYEKE